MFFHNKAILFIHGFVGGSYDFGNLNNELAVYKDFDVFTFTLPGHDLTIVKDVSYEDWIKESKKQIKFLLDHNYKEIYLIGHSMGGVIASYLASIYPQVKKLVLVAPSFGYFSFTDGKLDIKSFNDTLKNVKNIIGEQLISRVIKTPISTMLEFTKLVNTHYNSIENIVCPTLIIHGNDDQIVPKEAAEYVYNNIKSKSVKLYNVKHLNHNCFREKRISDINDLIINFLRKNQTNKKETLNI